MTDRQASSGRCMRPWLSLFTAAALGACGSDESDPEGTDTSSIMTDSSASQSAMPSSTNVPTDSKPGGATATSGSDTDSAASGTTSSSESEDPLGAGGAGGGGSSIDGPPEPQTSGGGEGGSPSDSEEPDGGGDESQEPTPNAGGAMGDGDTTDEGAESVDDESAGNDDESAGNDDESAGNDDESAGNDDTENEPVTFPTCPDETWSLVWGDDFDGPAGSAVDGSKWVYDSGPNWYNGELQTYTTGTDNASLDGNGNLVIEARREDREGRQYSSARLKTEGRHSFTYGRMEGRMKLPYGQGMWPALWMLGGTSWPNDGEIDIMENLGREPTIAHGTIHGPGYSGADGPGASYTLPDGAPFSDDFHIFSIEWEPNEIRWYIDGEHYSTKTPSDIGGNRWVFDHAFFFIVNLAVGGEWPGDPDETTVFPQHFLIDYIRVCQK